MTTMAKPPKAAKPRAPKPPPDPADPKVQLKPLLAATPEPAIVEVPELTYLMVEGRGGPEAGPAEDRGFQEAIGAIYPVAFTLKFALKAQGLQRTVMPLEALWWTDGEMLDLTKPQAAWSWRAMMVVADEVTPERFAAAVEAVRLKRETPGLDRLRLERWAEGRCAQLMHIGRYSAEGPNIERLHAFIASQGLSMRGYHHEIYLGDPRTAAPEKLRTLIRQPVG